MVLRPVPLDAAAFAPFGDVIETEGRESRWINDATCRRFDDLAHIDVAGSGGRPLVSIFEASPRSLPFEVISLERHPLSSQAFFPLQERAFLVVVASAQTAPAARSVQAFLSSGRQGVNYKRNTWHHALIALDETSRFLVVDRGASDANCEELRVDGAVWVTL